jgi:hypothetical protein
MKSLGQERAATVNDRFSPSPVYEVKGPKIVHVRVSFSSNDDHVVSNYCRGMIGPWLWLCFRILNLDLLDFNFPANARLQFVVFKLVERKLLSIIIDILSKVIKDHLLLFVVPRQIHSSKVGFAFLFIIFDHMRQLDSYNIIETLFVSLSSAKNVNPLPMKK